MNINSHLNDTQSKPSPTVLLNKSPPHFELKKFIIKLSKKLKHSAKKNCHF